jgi:hypothetical protein
VPVMPHAGKRDGRSFSGRTTDCRRFAPLTNRPVGGATGLRYGTASISTERGIRIGSGVDSTPGISVTQCPSDAGEALGASHFNLNPTANPNPRLDAAFLTSIRVAETHEQIPRLLKTDTSLYDRPAHLDR